MDKATLKLALHIFKFFSEQWAAYEADCKDWARQGYRPHHCFHGMNLWTDYDPICGPCEDGYGWFDREAFRKLALDLAKGAFKEFNERLDFYQKAAIMHAPLDQAKIIPWVGEPLQKWGEYNPRETVVIAYDPPF